MEWLTNVADLKMLVEIRSLVNNFIEDLFKFRNNAYLIILTYICWYFFIVACYSVHTPWEN